MYIVQWFRFGYNKYATHAMSNIVFSVIRIVADVDSTRMWMCASAEHVYVRGTVYVHTDTYTRIHGLSVFNVEYFSTQWFIHE